MSWRISNLKLSQRNNANLWYTNVVNSFLRYISNSLPFTLCQSAELITEHVNEIQLRGSSKGSLHKCRAAEQWSGWSTFSCCKQPRRRELHTGCTQRLQFRSLAVAILELAEFNSNKDDGFICVRTILNFAFFEMVKF